MTLDYECLRDVLKELENVLEVSDRIEHFGARSLSFHPVSLDKLSESPELRPYSRADVFYCLYNLQQAHMIDADIVIDGCNITRCIVFDITYDGHMFLRNISNETVWTLLKEKFGPAIHASLPVLQDIAKHVILNNFLLA